jgi:Bacterial Ig-like domain (group 2)/Divergent InlB B-repeat domain
MIRKWFRLTLACTVAIFLSSCGHDQQLVSISIQPTTETFGASNIPVSANAGSTVQLRALGSYIHPPVTKDITTQVTWASNTPDIATVDSTGLLTATGLACGDSLVSATVTTNNSGAVSSKGALVTGSMTANVICFSGTGPVLMVSVSGNGSVSSSPAGITCPTLCSASFVSGSTIVLTATPNSGATSVSWSNCQVISAESCSVNNLTSNLTVTATFN